MSMIDRMDDIIGEVRGVLEENEMIWHCDRLLAQIEAAWRRIRRDLVRQRIER